MATDKDINVPNKTDYISREAAIEATCKMCHDVSERYGEKWECVDGGITCCAGINALKNVPAADVRPVVKSRWIEIDDYALCANCGVAEHSPNRNYCHWCGADMRENVTH